MMADISDGSAGVQALTTSNPRTHFMRADVCSPEDCRQLVETTVSKFGRIDVLINNSALLTHLIRRPLEELSVKEWQDVLAVNVIGVFVCVRAVVPVMKSQRGGKIINVGSNAAYKGLPNLLHYVASKGAVHAMTRALARELGSFNVTVNAIAPGYVLHEGTAKTDQGRNDQVIKLRALARTETPGDLLGTIVFLASEESDFITGQTIVVDGGEVLA